MTVIPGEFLNGSLRFGAVELSVLGQPLRQLLIENGSELTDYNLLSYST